MFIDGIGISGYRSFGPEVQRIGPFKKINLIIGQNNSGKSNVLRFLKEHYPSIAKGASPELKALDKHLGDSTNEHYYEIALAVNSKPYQQMLDLLVQYNRKSKLISDKIEIILSSKIFTENTDLAWFPYIAEGRQLLMKSGISQKFLDAGIFPNSIWQDIWHVLTRQNDGNILQHWIPETLSKLSPINLPDVNVSLIPGIREVIDGNGTDDELMSGRGLVKRLAKLEKPQYDQLHLKDQFEKINHFLQTVIGNNNARIEIPSEQNLIQMSMSGRTLPLSHLGTGVHEVIIMAAIATILQNQVVCIEEPEIHLHPLLQKQLLKYLAELTKTNYFIATHSAHILDVPDLAIFHVRLEDDKSVVEPVLTDSHRSIVCDELGFRASDLLQANSIIWVEGPSDRIYLNHWIQSEDDSLVEGIHYSIMFYGGRLLSHLSGEDIDQDEVDDFISLRRLNRHAVIMIDSDKKDSEAGINQTKQRIQTEFDNGLGHAWITEGREIENYLDANLVEETVKAVHKNVKKITRKGQYDNTLRYSVDGGGDAKNANKVKVARKVIQTPANLGILDLQEQVTKLVAFIKESNGLQ